MAKDPAFLFYPGDWLGGTMTFTWEHKGAYMDLLMAQFNQWALTIDDIKYILGVHFEVIWEVKLRSKFDTESDGKLFFNRKLREEMLKRKIYCESRRNNKDGKNQHKKESKKSGHMTYHMRGHMENTNVHVHAPSSTPDLSTIPLKASVFSRGLLMNFEDIWSKYPKRVGKKAALRHYKASVLNENDMDDIHTALNNYIQSETVLKGFVQNGSTWFNNWRDYLDITVATGKSKDLLELQEMMNNAK